MQSHPAEVNWSSQISTAAEMNSLSNNPIHPVNEFTLKVAERVIAQKTPDVTLILLI